MFVRRGKTGATLLELILATALVTIAALTMSNVFAKNSKSFISDQQRGIAAELALSKIETLKSQPYAYLDATDAGLISAAACDCSNDDFSSLPSTAVVSARITFSVKSCVNSVDSNFVSQCPPADSGYKNIQVRVSWKNQNQTLSVTQQAMKTRY